MVSQGFLQKVALVSTVGLLMAGVAEASTTSLTGNSGQYTLQGTDTYGLGAVFIKGANFLSDSNLNKIVGVGAGIGSLVLLNAARYGQGAMVALIAMAVGFFPKMVDGLYGAMI